MKKEQREIYKKLIHLPTGGNRHWSGLCNVCRYAQFTGYCCDEADLECHVGIEAVEENAYDAWAGSDCWAFRPKWPLEDIVDAIGLMLQGEYPDMTDCKVLGKKEYLVRSGF